MRPTEGTSCLKPVTLCCLCWHYSQVLSTTTKKPDELNSDAAETPTSAAFPVLKVEFSILFILEL